MDMLDKKKRCYEALLKITGDMEASVEAGDYDVLSDMSVLRDEMVADILAMDRDSEVGQQGDLSPSEKDKIGEIYALAEEISEKNRWLSSKIDKRSSQVEKELRQSRKTSMVVSKYEEASRI